jgi:hypothetical protein
MKPQGLDRLADSGDTADVVDAHSMAYACRGRLDNRSRFGCVSVTCPADQIALEECGQVWSGPLLKEAFPNADL